VHRDVKPGNLMLERDGSVRITDFGLCHADGAENLTRTTDMLGTLRYMAPEQLRGETDARSDVCSLGLVLHELLTRRPARDASDRLRLVQQVADGHAPAPRRVERRIPRDLETIVLKATDHDPQMRYAGAAAMARDLPDGTLRYRVRFGGKAGPPHIAPDGERFACGDTVGNVTVLDARTYERHGVLPGSAHPWSLRFLPVGRLAVACFDGHIRVWDPDTLALVERLSGHDFIVRSMARLPGAAALVSGADGELKVWELPPNRARSVLRQPAAAVAAHALDDRFLATGGWNGLVYVWDVPRGERVAELSGHEGVVMGMGGPPDVRENAVF